MSNLKNTKKINDIQEEELKGLLLERDAHQFLWDHGYLVFSRLELFAIRYKQTKGKDDLIRNSLEKLSVTDLDCYGISFGKYLEKLSFLIDCKHKSENIFSQILRIKGISKILNINNLLVLRESVPETVQQFADKFNIRLLAINPFREKIARREKGSFSFYVYKKIYKLYKNRSPTTFEIIAKFSNCFLENDPYQRIKNLRVLFNELKEKIGDSKDGKNITLENYLLFRIFLYSLVTIAEIAGDTIHLSKYHFSGYIEQKLIGNIDFKKKMFALIRLIENDIIPNNKSFNPLKELSPTFTNPLKELIKEFQENSKTVQKYLQFNDFIIHEFFLLDKKLNIEEIKKELGDLDRDLFGKWNIKILEILNKEKTFPIFMVELLT